MTDCRLYIVFEESILGFCEIAACIIMIMVQMVMEVNLFAVLATFPVMRLVVVHLFCFQFIIM